jgi:ABC-type multidrug transport system ATPase subunit
MNPADFAHVVVLFPFFSVSGGEKKRVTVAEMLCVGTPVVCCDEISTGLDAATTFDITRLFALVTRLNNTTKVISLLQPPPETVANFDEIILLAEGMVIYCGPMEDIIDHFESLGYSIPVRMDMADWLQVSGSQRDVLVGIASGSKPSIFTLSLGTSDKRRVAVS